MGLSRFFQKAASGASKLFGKVGNVVKKVADFSSPIIRKVGEYARPVADAVSATALAFGQPEIAALAQGAGRAVEKGAKKLDKWAQGAQNVVDALGHKTSSKITKAGDKMQSDAQNKKTLKDYLE